MPENPLLPNAELRALHTLLKRAAKATPFSPFVCFAREPRSAVFIKENGHNSCGSRLHLWGKWSTPHSGEALLAATLQQLQPGDLLLAPNPVPANLLPQNLRAPALPPSLPFLPLATAAAAALPTAPPRPIALALLQSGLSTPLWPEALAWAQSQRLPLILAIADPSGANALRPTKAKSKPKSLTWATLSKLASKIKLPILTVDGEDAVAVYRVMQESALRARSGDGPAILWAVLPTPRELAAGRPPSATPLRRLQRFLRARNITP